jgi:peptidyl-tRNA hydrolase, PTH1 family
MKLIVGLGNPGEKYHNTRHNCGFMVLDHLLQDFGSHTVEWTVNEKLKSDTAAFTVHDEKVLLAKPRTYMNDSGFAVQLLKDFYKVEPEDIWIVYDELDLPVGSMKIRFGGAAAGHHGVESIMEKIGTDGFWRFRLGIGESHDKERPLSKQTVHNAKEYVLDQFSHSEAGKSRDMIKKATEALQVALEKGMETAMNRFNTK